MSGVPYVDRLGGRDAAKVIAETPVRLGLILDGLSTAEIEARPAPGKWSVREIVAHLADCEIAWGWRLRQVYGEDHVTIQPFEQDAWARCMTRIRSSLRGLRLSPCGLGMLRSSGRFRRRIRRRAIRIRNVEAMRPCGRWWRSWRGMICIILRG